ncbi:hypothetical protein VCHA54P500_90094 [Vibrio chagasii]|nr:hypothetical protein VCHA31O73_140067 [Vibrio chagasii]CAH6818862.1 hypothetical protein VCHA35O143_150040 [Vibrio chagasii]CAH6822753.1 hypothetical protein VCHA35O141_160040 [Vibrio chagasii]CAH6978685.1 hypothetical protein VCHA53O480_150067 [Vibrio chagasii]CAH7032813.1 hypothetical protein VCHA50O396_160067 [Vibrio chagasii]
MPNKSNSINPNLATSLIHKYAHSFVAVPAIKIIHHIYLSRLQTFLEALQNFSSLILPRNIRD